MKGFIKSIYKSISDFYLPEHKEKDAEQTEPLSSVNKEKKSYWRCGRTRRFQRSFISCDCDWRRER